VSDRANLLSDAFALAWFVNFQFLLIIIDIIIIIREQINMAFSLVS